VTNFIIEFVNAGPFGDGAVATRPAIGTSKDDIHLYLKTVGEAFIALENA